MANIESGTGRTETTITRDTENNLDTPAQSGGRLQFPSKYDAEDGNWLTFTRYKYSRASKTDDAKPQKQGKTVALPPPGSLQVSYGAQWEEVEIGLFGRHIKEPVGNLIGNLVDKGGATSYADEMFSGINSVGKAIDAIKAGASDMWKSIPDGTATAYALDTFLGSDLARKAGVYSGVARNPFAAFIYNGPQFRSFSFDYEFIPKSRQEADEIRDIIRQFKLGLSPSFNDTYNDNMFEYPDTFGISFLQDSHLFKMAPCALKDLSVDYHGQGGPVYFEGKIPFSIKIGLVFQELKILTREDFEANNY